MFQFRRFPPYTYEFSIRCLDMTPDGLLHSEIHGSMPTYGSPWLIAVSRVLLRLPVPRHSPCALCSLTIYDSSLLNRSSLPEIVVITLNKPSDLFPEITSRFLSASALFSFQGTIWKFCLLTSFAPFRATNFTPQTTPSVFCALRRMVGS